VSFYVLYTNLDDAISLSTPPLYLAFIAAAKMPRLLAVSSVQAGQCQGRICWLSLPSFYVAADSPVIYLHLHFQRRSTATFIAATPPPPPPLHAAAAVNARTRIPLELG